MAASHVSLQDLSAGIALRTEQTLVVLTAQMDALNVTVTGALLSIGP